MKVKFKILAFVSICIGVYFLLNTIWYYKEKSNLESILKNGNIEIGIIENVNSGNKHEILVRLTDKTISKEMSESDNYYQVGDTVQLYNYAKYPEKYVFEYEYIYNFAIIAGLVMTVFFLSPIILLLKKKPVANKV